MIKLTRTLRFIILGLLIFFAALFTVHRVALETYGRKAPLYRTDSSELVRLKKVGDLEASGRVSLFTGRDILELYRAQLPVNPFVFTQFQKLTITPENTYLIAQKRSVFKDLKSSLPGVRVYTDRRGHQFNGNWFPDAFILTTSMAPDAVREQPISELDYGNISGRRYLWFKTPHELDLFISGPPPEKEVNVILPNPRSSFPERFFHRLGEILRLGKEVRLVEAGDVLSGARLFLTRKNLDSALFRGMFENLSFYFYLVGFVSLGVVGGLLGFHQDEKFVAWAAWSILIVILAPFYQFHKFLTGLLAAGILRLGWKRKSRSLIWYFLSGLFSFGLLYASYLVVPSAWNWSFWPGFILGGLLLVSFPPGWRKRNIRLEEFAYSLLVLLVFTVIFYPGVFYRNLLPLFKAGMLVLLPTAGWYFPRWGNKRGLLKLVAMVGWFQLFVSGAGWMYLFVFAGALILWELEQIYLNPDMLSHEYL